MRSNFAPVEAVAAADVAPPLEAVPPPDELDAAEAASESPVLLAPAPGARLTCWVGAGERAEFLRQNALLANVWTGLGAATAIYQEPDRHHFNVLDGLAEPAHPLTRTLLAA